MHEISASNFYFSFPAKPNNRLRGKKSNSKILKFKRSSFKINEKMQTNTKTKKHKPFSQNKHKINLRKKEKRTKRHWTYIYQSTNAATRSSIEELSIEQNQLKKAEIIKWRNKAAHEISKTRTWKANKSEKESKEDQQMLSKTSMEQMQRIGTTNKRREKEWELRVRDLPLSRKQQMHWPSNWKLKENKRPKGQKGN